MLLHLKLLLLTLLVLCSNVPIYYRNLSSYGLITSGSSGHYTNEFGIATANLNIDRTDIPSGSETIQIEATIQDP